MASLSYHSTNPLVSLMLISGAVLWMRGVKLTAEHYRDKFLQRRALNRRVMRRAQMIERTRPYTTR